MIRGSCYCGAVRYEVHGKLLMFPICHCPDCRKITGAACSPVLVTEAAGFTIASGGDHLVPFESSPGKFRHFCRTCGSPLFSRVSHRPDMVFIRAGSLDDDPPLRPQVHYWTAMKAPWHEITDALPQHAEGVQKR